MPTATSLTPTEQLINSHVRQLGTYNAGLSTQALKQKYAVERIVKLGSNENPFETPDSVRQILMAPDNLAHYPDPNAESLKKQLSRQLGVPSDTLVIGNGSEDIIQMIARTCLNPGDKVVTVIPSFGLHILYPQACGADVITVPMTDSLQFDINRLTQTLIQQTPKLCFIASPSNPVGCFLSADDITRLLQALTPQTLLIFDEAYYEYARIEAGYPDVLHQLRQSRQPFILLRTLSKAYSLAGLRVGYGICEPRELTDYLDRVRTPFNVNHMAQKAAIAALHDHAHLHKTRNWNQIARDEMCRQLRQLGLSPAPSVGNFVFFATPFRATELAQRLLKQGIIIKPWLENGYEDYIRVSIGNCEDNQYFIDNLRHILATPDQSLGIF
jgi:histidinol-phosphate aminotransferase